MAGMSMFSTKNGLYERARKKFKIQDGIKLFSYPFYKQRRSDVQVGVCNPISLDMFVSFAQLNHKL